MLKSYLNVNKTSFTAFNRIEFVRQLIFFFLFRFDFCDENAERNQRDQRFSAQGEEERREKRPNQEELRDDQVQGMLSSFSCFKLPFLGIAHGIT